VFYTTLLNSNNIELTLPIEGAFYAQVILDIPGHILYGCAGDTLIPLCFIPATLRLWNWEPSLWLMRRLRAMSYWRVNSGKWPYLYPLMHGLGLYS
jgi:hypothetical protein